MSLVDEFKARVPEWHDDSAHFLGAKQVHYDLLDERRWGHVVEYVYQRGDEYARVEYTEGSGDSDYDYEPEWTEVRPVEKTIISYESV